MAKILIVDDSVVIRMMLTHTLTTAGHHIAGEAENGASALSLYKETQPEIVILDLGIPDIDGREVLRQIKALNPGAKVVICTAVRLQETQQEVKGLGATAYLTKPVNPKELLDTIHTCCD